MMRLFFVTFVLAFSCSTLKSELSIPPNETFILGEENRKNYSAELIIKSNLTIKLKKENKNTGELIQESQLASKDEIRILVNNFEIVKLINENNKLVKIGVKLNRGVEGMRYIKN